jgi:hypothetical protein
MSKTGTYMVIDGKVQCVSRETPKLASRIDGAYFRQPYVEKFNGKVPYQINSKGDKKAIMKSLGICEAGDTLADYKFEKKKKVFDLTSTKGMAT